MFEDYSDMNDKQLYEEMRAVEEEINRKNQAVLDQVAEKVSKEVFDEIQELLNDDMNAQGFMIVDHPKGKLQDVDEFPAMGGYWCDQTTNGGYSGDEFAGTCSVKLNDKEYFEFTYSM